MGLLAEVLAKEADADFCWSTRCTQPNLPPGRGFPYLPTTRRFTTPSTCASRTSRARPVEKETRADVLELGAELSELNLSHELIERNPIYQAKLDVLHEMHSRGRTPEREAAFREYIEREGQGLVDFAAWCAQREVEQIHAPRAHAIVPNTDELVNFYMWLQFLCDEQLAAAQARAKAAGMKIGIMADLAVGVHPGGADAHNLEPWLAPDISVGAPPDNYNQQGQDWSQPPWHPNRLAEAGYAPGATSCPPCCGTRAASVSTTFWACSASSSCPVCSTRAPDLRAFRHEARWASWPSKPSAPVRSCRRGPGHLRGVGAGTCSRQRA